MDLRASVREVRHVLGAGLDPSHRPTEPPRQPRDHHIFGVVAELAPEAAAHVGDDDAHGVGVHTERRGDPTARVVDGLRRRPLREPVTVPSRRARARFDRRDGHAAVDQARLDDNVAAIEQIIAGRVVVALTVLVAAAGNSSNSSSPACSGSTSTGSGSYSTSTSSAASAACSGVCATTTATASPAKRTTSSARNGRHIAWFIIGISGGAGGRSVRSRRSQHGHHSGRGACGLGAQGSDPRVRHRGAHKHHVQRARQIEIRNVGATDGEQRVVLHAAHRRADEFACRLYHRTDTTRRNVDATTAMGTRRGRAVVGAGHRYRDARCGPTSWS